MAARNWTPEQRNEQAAKICAWRPWEQSTGPRTPDGKARASRNAENVNDSRTVTRNALRELRAMLKTQRECLHDLDRSR